MGGPRINRELQAAAAVEETLDALERLFDEAAKPGRQASSETRKRMRRKALELCAESGPDWAGVDTAVLRFGADSFCSIAVDLAAHPSETARLIEGIEATTRIGRAVLGYEVLRSPQLLLLPTAVAVEVQLDLLLAFAEVAAVSLWTLEAGGELKLMRYAGDLQLASKEIRRLARRMLTRAEPSIRTAGHAVLGVRIERWG